MLDRESLHAALDMLLARWEEDRVKADREHADVVKAHEKSRRDAEEQENRRTVALENLALEFRRLADVAEAWARDRGYAKPAGPS